MRKQTIIEEELLSFVNKNSLLSLNKRPYCVEKINEISKYVIKGT
tara:strand:+ start:131 stop:265 length:135 start_codon:yes stop_codon:yes gene_type:complete